MIGKRHEIPRLQSVFYRDSYRKILRGLIFSVGFMVLLVMAIIYFTLFRPSPEYYATTTTGQIIPMTGVHE